MSSFDEDWSRQFEDEWEKWPSVIMNDDDDDASNHKLEDLDTSSMSVDSSQHEQELQEQPRQQDSPSKPQQHSTRELVAALGGDKQDSLPEPIQHRIRDFRLAQRKRRETYGNERPWGILGLYDHLASIRIDLEWAEDAAWRRQHGEPYLSWSDFDKEHKRGAKNRPYFTYFLMFFCTIMMIASIGVNGWRFEKISVNPMIGPSAETLLKMGAKQTSLIVNGGQWFRLFSPIVLHAGLIHFFLNMFALWFVGGAVEKSHGLVNAAIIFVLPATGGNILSALFLPQYISVGASGGIFGLIGSCIADISLNWNMLFLKQNDDEETNAKCKYVMVLGWLCFDIIINCLIGLTPFVDNFTHLGGMIYGLLCGLSTIEPLAHGFFGLRKFAPCSFFLRFFGLILSVVGIMVSVAVLVGSDGTSNPCHGCRYVSCVPFPPGAAEKWWYCDDCAVVSGQAKKDDPSNPNLFSTLDLTCPDGVIEPIDISDLNMTQSDEIQSIQNILPSLCRHNCESIYKDAGL
jgi:membrane associated rhomboid family serine protease